MSSTVVRVSAPSRLHFGLLTFGHSDRRQFGGAGVMLARPRCEIEIEPHDGFRVGGPTSERAQEFAERWAACRPHRLDCELRVVRAIPAHVGLGSGTQLALSVAAGFNVFFGRRSVPPAELAASVHRGSRSAVGTHGFAMGGFIIEEGKLPGESLAPLRRRVPLPSTWRFVLIRVSDHAGLSGRQEQEAFHSLPAVPNAVTLQLKRLLYEQMLPAAEANDCGAFGHALFQYGVEAGHCFATRQGGPFASPRLQAIVDELRNLGVHGVGQSSWGPTIFALTANDDEAHRLVSRVKSRTTGSALEIEVSAVDNQGAKVQCVPSSLARMG